MDKKVEIQAGLEFGPEQFATFAPIAPIIEAFGFERGLRVSRVFDRDPVGPAACYFVSWHRSFVRVCAINPFVVCVDFRIVVVGPRRTLKSWDYSANEGIETLRSILEEAKALSNADALSPEEEAALLVRVQEQQAKIKAIIEKSCKPQKESKSGDIDKVA